MSSSSITSLEKTGTPAWRFWGQAILSLLGLGVSLYLTWIKVSGGSAFCAGVGDCETVQNSIYSELFGIPIALFGAGFYAMLLALVLVRRQVAERRQAEYALVGQLALLLTGVLYSGYLTYIEVFVILAICPWCVTSALIVTVLLILTAYDMGKNRVRL